MTNSSKHFVKFWNYLEDPKSQGTNLWKGNCNYHLMSLRLSVTLAAEMFGVGGFWLEIRVIILDIQEPLTDFHRNEAKKMKKKVQNGRLK